MSIAAFTDPWYAERIAQEAAGKKVSPDAEYIGHSLMIGAAFIAQAIDNAFGPDRKDEDDDSTRRALRAIADNLPSSLAIEEIAVAIRELAEATKH